MIRRPVTLIAGAGGEVGYGLIDRFAAAGDVDIVALDLKPLPDELRTRCTSTVVGDILDRDLLRRLHEKYQIDAIFHLAALLSTAATGQIDWAIRAFNVALEQNPNNPLPRIADARILSRMLPITPRSISRWRLGMCPCSSSAPSAISFWSRSTSTWTFRMLISKWRARTHRDRGCIAVGDDEAAFQRLSRVAGEPVDRAGAQPALRENVPQRFALARGAGDRADAAANVITGIFLGLFAMALVVYGIRSRPRDR